METRESDSDSEENEGMAGGVCEGMGGLGVMGKGTGMSFSQSRLSRSFLQT